MTRNKKTYTYNNIYAREKRESRTSKQNSNNNIAMRTKEQFVKPAILREVTLEEGGSLLAGSIVDQVEILSAGQEVHDIDATSPEFDWSENWNWED